jgi:hypothetical protein
LPIHTTGEAIFEVIGDFIRDSHLDWGRCAGISTDGARAMTGAKKGVALSQAVALETKSNLFFIHKEALATLDVPAYSI